jgi:hypothetical protein
MKKLIIAFVAIAAIVNISACKKETKDEEPKLIFKFKFDPTQDRYDSFGQLSNTLPAGNAGVSPKMNSMAGHYIELTPSAFVAVGSGTVLYHAPEVTKGGETGIDHSKSVLAGEGEVFFSIPLKDVKAGEYEYLRISVAYQNYTVDMHYDTTFQYGSYTVVADEMLPSTVASFIGYNTYINTFDVADAELSVNGFRKQGFWGSRQNSNINFKDKNSGTVVSSYPLNYTTSAQGPSGTTVPNPLFASSPIPNGSCLVTGGFDGGKLKITGKETKDVVVTASFSTNKSFEWKDLNGNNKWEPTKGEYVVDMGVRGLKAFVQ